MQKRYYIAKKTKTKYMLKVSLSECVILITIYYQCFMSKSVKTDHRVEGREFI